MLWRRLFGAACILAPVLLLFWLEDRLHDVLSGVCLVPLATLVAGAGAKEMTGWLQARGMKVVSSHAVFGAAAVTFMSAVPYWFGQPMYAAFVTLGTLIVVMMATFATCMTRFAGRDDWFDAIARTLLITCYLGLPMSCLVHLRLGPSAGREGLLLIFGLLFIVKMSDVGAYFVGRTLGRHASAPRLSPKKTWEGVAGGLAAGLIATYIVLGPLANYVLDGDEPIAWLPTIGAGLLVTAAGMVGDLAESLLKRDLEMKDASDSIPGLGGIMDVVDSVLFAAPVGYFFWLCGWFGHSAPIGSIAIGF